MAALQQGIGSVLINGEDTRLLDCADRGVQYGDGVFTTLPVRQGVPLFLGRHLARLQADAERLGIMFPGHMQLQDEAGRLVALNPDCILKIMLTRGVGGRGYRCPALGAGTRILSVHPLPDYPAQIQDQGVAVRQCALRLGLNPRLAGIKHLNRLEQVLARAEWQDESIREGLLLDSEGFLVEGVMSNVFLSQRGRLHTPLLDRCGVAGVMRGLVLEAAGRLGIAVEERRLLPEEIQQADEIFLTNSVIGLWPVCSVEAQAFPVGALTRLLTGEVNSMALEE